MLPWLMKPYTDNRQQTAKELRFNHRLSRARMVVECAFGRLKGRWRSLLKHNDTNVKFLAKYIAACCVLHNICEIHKDAFNDEWMIQQSANENAPTVNTQTTGVSNSSVEADAIRVALSDYILVH